MEHEVYERFFWAEDSHWWFRARRRILDSVLARLYPRGGLKIADVGCGTGGMMKMLSRFGRVTGVDEAPEAREYCRERGFTNVLTQEVWEEDRTLYDLVTAFDVVEHVEDDVGFLSRLHRKLEPGGTILITVPAYQFLWSVFDEMNHHKRRYSRGRLLRGLGQAGFRVERSSYFNTLLLAPVVLVRFLEKLTKPGVEGEEEKAKSLDRWFKVGPLNRPLEAIFASERHWLEHSSFPMGSSILAVGRKDGP